ncbi:hypothetical protein [Acidovorax radicis]|jgi:hypothetical protein|uniref:hypothetical protein n=1 Tax=Acidovorax radicis TaxID=758826 RepID=UPI001CFB04D2|nr:hypothetical protein [Acidovorax radicis]UCV00904.1 hypothetical protein KI609_09270 [Acidovorax radicis]
MKFAALFLNGLAILLLGWGLYGVIQLSQARTPTLRPIVSELAPLPPALRNEQSRVVDAFDAMARVQAQAARAGTDPLGLIALPVPGSEVVGSVQMPRRSLSLHLDDLSAETQSVVIDGRLVRQGARLDGGGRIVRVRPNEAVVVERLGRQTLTLPEGELRVGTLRWADGSLASVNSQEFKAGLPGGQPGPIRSLP